MTPPKDVIILGTGGNSIDILDTMNDVNEAADTAVYRCVGFLDDDPNRWGREILGVNVLGPLSAAHQFPRALFINGIGSPTNFWNKPAIIAKAGVSTDRFVTLIHPSASVSRLARIAPGVVLFQNVTITSNVKINEHVIVLPNSIVSHDDVIGEYGCIAGGVCISGGVSVGTCCYLGSNSTVINDIRIGDRCLIGMASVVIRDVPQNSVVVGNPAKFIRQTCPDGAET